MKVKMNTRWNGKELKCACLYGNPACDRYKTCETLDLKLSTYEGLEDCMKERSYKRVNGVMKQR